MQFKFFIIPTTDTGSFTEELNRFLRSKKVLDVQQQLVQNSQGAYWSLSVRYIENAVSSVTSGFKEKKDYKTLLDEPTFAKFSKLRQIRKEIAAEEALPAFAIFTDEELVNMARLKELTPEGIKSIPGIGEKKIARFGLRMIASYTQ